MKPVRERAPRATLVSRRIIIRDLELGAKIGVYTHERMDAQMIRINIDLGVSTEALADRIEDVVSYEEIVARVKALCARGHVNLVETLAEGIADLCLEDPRVEEATVRLEKLHAIAEAAGVGCEVQKRHGFRGRKPRTR